jgi:leader peptidase (prepilin peptidase)/N-methyltransferase
MDSLFWSVTIALIFAFGASIGSFLNVVVYRLPAGLSILFPASRCPQCLHRLGQRENVPVLGWLWLRGRCRHCHTRISPRYPLVEAATGLLFVAAFGWFGFSLETLGAWVLLSWLLALSLIDWDTLTLPHPLTQSGLVLGLAFMALVGGREAHNWRGSIAGVIGGIAGAVLGIWLLDAIAVVGSIFLGKTAMGAGDAKLAAMMGAWLGWQYFLVAGFLACLLGALIGTGAIALGRHHRQHPLPFGPFLALGTAITFFWGEIILSTYLELFFPLTALS